MSLYIRGDFHCCPNPLSADSYSICEANCCFCFVKILEETILKNKAKKGLQPINTKELEKKLKKAFRSEKETQDSVVRALRYGLPVIVGRKCEPFCDREVYDLATYRMLKLLKDYDVTTVIETKCTLLKDKEVEKTLIEMNAGVNITITPGNDELAKKLNEPTSYTERWGLASELKDIGLWVGVTGEPIISGVNDSTPQLLEWAEKCKDLRPTHVNFGDLRVSSLKIMAKRMSDSGFNLADIIRAKKETWAEKGKEIFEILHNHNLTVTTPDWVNFGLKNDTESCCGFQGLQFKLHHFTFQHAVLEIKRKGKVSWGEMGRLCIFGEKYLAKFKEIWNGKGGYFNLADVKGVSKIGRDGEGNAIYGKAKSLKEAFI